MDKNQSMPQKGHDQKAPGKTNERSKDAGQKHADDKHQQHDQHKK